MAAGELLRIDTVEAGPVYVAPWHIYTMARASENSTTRTCITILHPGGHPMQFTVEGDVDEIAAMFESNAKMSICRVN
jgi:hypothetical protein